MAKMKKLSTIRNSLFRLWTKACLEEAHYTCIICGAKTGDLNDNGNQIKINSHHIISRDIKNSFLKFNLINAIALCPKCHKFGNYSAHKNPLFLIDFLLENSPEKIEYLRKHQETRIDLDNRDVLEAIRIMLLDAEALDLEKIREIEDRNPKKSKTITGNLLEEFACPA